MTRITGSRWRYEPSVDLTLALILGPCYDVTDEMLEVGWRVEGEGLMGNCRRNPNHGWRPYGWWAFDAQEPKPEGRVAEARRLAELGALWPEEVEALERRAKEAREGWAWRNADRFPEVAGWKDEESVKVWNAVAAITEA